jgi:SAM-dependent methyltransferase
LAHDAEVHAGQAVYTPLTLKAYDWFVHGFSNHFLWRCPTRELESLYHRNVSGRHLDIGVGTGYFLARARWPAAVEITLVDLNAHSLAAAARRIDRHVPETVIANVLDPELPIESGFESVGLCYLLHCLPGTMAEKAVVFDHVLPLMAENAVLFGATIVQGDAPRSRAAQALMDFYNRKGIFTNAADTHDALAAELQKRFATVTLARHGAVTVFEARSSLTK